MKNLADLKWDRQLLKYQVAQCEDIEKLRCLSFKLSDATEALVLATQKGISENYTAFEFVRDPIAFDSVRCRIEQKAAKLFWHFYLVRKVKIGGDGIPFCIWSPELTALLGFYWGYVKFK